EEWHLKNFWLFLFLNNLLFLNSKQLLMNIRILLLIGFIGLNLSFLNPDYLEWSKEKTLNYTDFKANPPSNVGAGKMVNLTTIISYKTEQIPGGIPKVTIMNLVDRNASW